MPAIETDGLTKHFGDVVAIDDLSFAVETGEIFGYLGPNGAGKTTTIRTLLGLLKPTSGSATVLGQPIHDESALIEARERVGYLSSDPGFDETATGAELVAFHGTLKGDERSDELLERFDPPVDRKIEEYSRGNRQMLAIVLAFMHDPDLVIMDEPTSGLDPLKQEEFYTFLAEEKAAGTTVFMSSHILSEVRRVCDRVGIVRNGRFVTVESVSELLGRSGKRVTVGVEGAVSRSDFEFAGVHDLRVDDTVSFTFTGSFDELIEHLGAYTVRELDVEEAPLEDVFMRFYGDEQSEESPKEAPTEEAVDA